VTLHQGPPTDLVDQSTDHPGDKREQR
jgi:hypothetical protein